MPENSIVDEISARLERLGDLPIFNASVNRIRDVSRSENSDAMGLAMEVMKDANLTAKLLRLANSPYYNRGLGKITVISKAVILLGFDTIKNMCITLKLIESFQHENPGVDMYGMLVNALLSAGMAREIAQQSGVRDSEESYICTLLHNLGEVITAYALPERYQDLLNYAKANKDVDWIDAQREVLGTSFAVIGQTIGKGWEFPAGVLNTMSRYGKSPNSPVNNKNDLNHALATFSHDTMNVIYQRPGHEGQQLGPLMSDLSRVSGMPRNVIERSMDEAFKMSCDLARDYGLNRKLLMPPVVEGEDETRNRIARTFAYYAGTQAGGAKPGADVLEPAAARPPEAAPESASDPASAAAETPEAKVAEQKALGDAMRQLELLQEITALITANTGVHRVFAKVIEGLHAGIGFERALLCLVSADRTQLQGRIGLGQGIDELKNIFVISTREQHNLFIRVLVEGNDRIVRDVRKGAWGKELPAPLAQGLGVDDFCVAPLRAGKRPVGLIYADKGVSNTPIDENQYRSFIQFCNQARLALQYAELNRNGG